MVQGGTLRSYSPLEAWVRTPLSAFLDHPNKTKKIGGAGYRSPCLSHAKRALYHVSYTPFLCLHPESYLFWDGINANMKSPCGPMDKAPAYGAGDSGFKSQQGLSFFIFFFFFFCPQPQNVKSHKTMRNKNLGKNRHLWDLNSRGEPPIDF